MKRIRQFIRTTIIGGLVVILPLTIFLLALKWLFGFVTSAIKPLTDLVVTNTPLPGLVADLIVIAVIVGACFLVGLFVRTKLGRILYEKTESSLLVKAPGYKLIKETVNQFVGRKQSPFSSVALVRMFENDTKATAFITDKHEDGSFTVFIPTGPNPTTGQIFHLDAEYVHPVEVSIEDAMRSIISCGAGSEVLVKAFKKKAADSRL
ncbi:MAG: DUF502 domain-containing protein [Kiritimatiellales bacterium]|nr:DUF502 domain-containing protein [Kiritimatiellales bacterium]